MNSRNKKSVLSQQNVTELKNDSSHSQIELGQEREGKDTATRQGGSRSVYFRKIFMNKDLIIAVAVTFLLAGAIGFYTGKYYEQQIRRKMIQQRMQNVQGQNGERQNREFRQFDGNRQPGSGMMRTQ